MIANYTIADWIAGTAILLATLIVPFVIRRRIARRPLSKAIAVLIASGIWLGLFSFFWWAASLVDLQDAYSRKPHLGILAIAVISYLMLTSTGKNTPRRANDGSSGGDSRLGTEPPRMPEYDSKRAAVGKRNHQGTAAPETDLSKSMNWKRGLLRLWIFASILWLGGAGSIAVLESSPTQQQRIPLTMEELAACEVESYLNAEPIVPDEPADLSQNNTSLSDVSEPRFGSFGARLDTTGLMPLCAARIENVRDWNLPERVVVFLIVGAPLFVIGLGMALAWIAGGFRDPNNDTI